MNRERLLSAIQKDADEYRALIYTDLVQTLGNTVLLASEQIEKGGSGATEYERGFIECLLSISEALALQVTTLASGRDLNSNLS